jgi:VWFA-related protein
MRALLALLLAAQTAAPPPRMPPVFQGDVELVRVAVVVRDRSGNPVRGLGREDFSIEEDGKAQTIEAFALEDIPVAPAPPATEEAAAPAAAPPILKPPAGVPPAVSAAAALAGQRLVVLLFDSVMPPEELERGVKSAREYVDKRMSAADRVAVAVIEGGLQVYTDFTADRTRLQAALDVVEGLSSDAAGPGADPEPAGDGDAPAMDGGLSSLDVDQRLRALETLATALLPLPQKKSVVYFSGGMGGTSVDNQVELRAAVNRAVRANVAIYPVDSRGLTAMPPGGDASQASSMTADAFAGRTIVDALDQRLSSQDTLASLASDTGGRTFFDSNDFGGVFERVLNDSSTYYVLGYSTTNLRRDGKFRRIKVKVKGEKLKVEHRSGYYAGKDFQHQNRDDRERAMREQLFTDLSLTDLPVCLRTAYFRAEEEHRFRVVVSIGVPGASVPFTRSGDDDRATLDLVGVLRDEVNRPVAELRDTIRVAAKATDDVRKKNVQYQKVLTVTPGRYRMKVVLRENKDGTMGSFETEIVVPSLRSDAVKLSSVVLGTQVQAVKGRTENPLAQNGSELVQSLTHVVSASQPMYFYYEVYDPTRPKGGGQALLRTSLQFLRGSVRQYETPLVEVTRLNAPERNAALFELAVPAGSLQPGFYVCQVSVIDVAGGTFAFPRVPLLVR